MKQAIKLVALVLTSQAAIAQTQSYSAYPYTSPPTKQGNVQLPEPVPPNTILVPQAPNPSAPTPNAPQPVAPTPSAPSIRKAETTDKPAVDAGAPKENIPQPEAQVPPAVTDSSLKVDATVVAPGPQYDYALMRKEAEKERKHHIKRSVRSESPHVTKEPPSAQEPKHIRTQMELPPEQPRAPVQAKPDYPRQASGSHSISHSTVEGRITSQDGHPVTEEEVKAMMYKK